MYTCRAETHPLKVRGETYLDVQKKIAPGPAMSRLMLLELYEVEAKDGDRHDHERSNHHHEKQRRVRVRNDDDVLDHQQQQQCQRVCAGAARTPEGRVLERHVGERGRV